MPRKPKTAPTGSNNITLGDISQSRAVAIGHGAQAIIHEAESSGDRERSLENFEQEKLARGIARLVGNLAQQAAQPPSGGNPFPLRPLTCADASVFYGRTAALQKAGQVLQSPLAILEGNPGLGKTSFLQAGLIPALIAQGHLPLYVTVSPSGGLTRRIKQTLIADLEKTPILRDAPLQFFIQSIAHHLQTGKGIFLLLDSFEEFSAMPAADQQNFIDELAQCLGDDTNCDHWLMCIPSSYLAHLTDLVEKLNQPFFPTSLKMRRLTRAEATEVLITPLQAQGIPPADDLLPVLLDDLGGDEIDPSQLQLVASSLYERSGGAAWTLPFYRETGGAGKIWEGYLDEWLNRNLDSSLRNPAWTVLAMVAQSANGAMEEWLILQGLRLWGLGKINGKELIAKLAQGGLLRIHEEGLRLSSAGFAQRALEWAQQRDMSALAQQEARRQTAHLRGSALRGLLGGGIGFSLAFLFNYTQETPDLLLCGYITLYRALPGGIAGLLLVLGLDVAANDPRTKRWMPWLVACLSGGLSFSFALLFHASLRLPAITTTNLLGLIPAGLLGLAWGALTGAVGLFCMRSPRPWWQVLLAVVVIGLLFGLLDGWAGAFGPGITLGKFLAGMVMPGLVLLAALFWRPAQAGE